MRKYSEHEQRRVNNIAMDCQSADPSDPFTAARVKAHFRNGIAVLRENDGDPTYNADSVVVRRELPPGQIFFDGTNEYPVTEYRNIRRP